MRPVSFYQTLALSTGQPPPEPPPENPTPQFFSTTPKLLQRLMDSSPTSCLAKSQAEGRMGALTQK